LSTLFVPGRLSRKSGWFASSRNATAAVNGGLGAKALLGRIGGNLGVRGIESFLRLLAAKAFFVWIGGSVTYVYSL
jgi:hypothetical protein